MDEQSTICRRLGGLFIAWCCLSATPLVADVPAYYDTTGFRNGEAGLTQSEKVGREIWYKATVGNDRFHSYVFS